MLIAGFSLGEKGRATVIRGGEYVMVGRGNKRGELNTLVGTGT